MTKQAMNKSIFFSLQRFLIILIFFTSCESSSSKRISITPSDNAIITFEENFYDFGNIKDGDTVSHVFHFINTGKIPLLINSVSTSCGCTAVDWPSKPIKPLRAGAITIQFSKRHDPGIHTKTAIVKANTENPYTVLRITALIK